MPVLTRRAAMIGAACLGLSTRRGVAGTAADTLAALERADGGRLGVAVLDTGTGRRLEHRAAERFPLCSTFKMIAAAAILARADRGEDSLERRVAYGPGDLLDYAPVTRERVAEGGMSLADLCAAAVVWSDNTAANLMLATLGGPEGLTRFIRRQDDGITRLDRTEPTLNEAAPGDPRDTTTPAAMLGLLRRLLVGDALAPASRERLVGWMIESPTGAGRLRAGLPPGWVVGDKTGTGDNGTANVVALVRRPGAAPLLAAVYLTGSPASPEARNALHADIGRLVAATFPAA
ncbi:MAG: class A beta-lactamase [Methylobacterium frigidaeris]